MGFTDMANRLDSMLTEKQRLAMMADMMGNPDAENMNVLARTAAIPSMPENYIQNSGTGAVTSLDEFAPNALMRQMQPALDYKSGPVEMGGMKGYRLAGDPFTVMMPDGSRLSLGNDMEAGMKRDKERIAIADAQQDIQKTAAETQLKQQELKDKQNPQKVAGFTSMKDVFDAENKLADDHKGQSKDFIGVRDAYSRLSTSLDAANASAPATLAAATTFMKLLDPGSVVRESELGMALAATGTLDRVQNTWQRMQKGQVLTPMQVAEFKSVAEKLYGAAEQNQRGLDEHYSARAKAYGLDPGKVVGDYYVKKPPAVETKQRGASGSFATEPSAHPPDIQELLKLHGGKRG